MSRFRPRMRVMGIAAAVVLVGALALRTDLGAVPGLRAPPAVLTPSQPVPVADKPASPCLASRFAYGVRVTPEGLRRIDRAEELVRELGFEVLRVRDHGDLARIEVPAENIARASELRQELGARLAGLGFKYVTLDLHGFRSGSLNALLEPPTLGPPSDPG